eukprot:366010-Chlamydomonas_euryale.AAC.4
MRKTAGAAAAAMTTADAVPAVAVMAAIEPRYAKKTHSQLRSTQYLIHCRHREGFGALAQRVQVQQRERACRGAAFVTSGWCGAAPAARHTGGSKTDIGNAVPRRPQDRRAARAPFPAATAGPRPRPRCLCRPRRGGGRAARRGGNSCL